ncbi:hypothetical protein OSB04_031570 [Centaurea solstitialis]|uniref:Integrase catalytic domain-containing protein n=1 Tax=Centaurea solstitialis TaxID=347529 RepID=A0AA38VUG4_9ASTR|nr:hypothetical protein OSB04_031570 [Centaurea solstitialis]
MVTQTIPNDLEPTVPIIIINLSNILKLTSTNYLSWKLQIEATLVGYGLFKFLDGSHPTPPPTIVKNNESVSNPAYLTWVRQDRLLFGALIGTLEHTIVPLISRTTTSQAMWETLANTFASASRGHIKQLKAQLKMITKGPQSITEFMQAVKVLTDQLAILGDPVKTEDITDKVLEGLDSSYQGVIDAVNARDTPISFAELHEKLINRELTIKAQPLLGAYPATVHHTSSRPIYHHNNRQSNTPHNIHHAHPHPKSTQLSSPNYTGQRPFLGRCQWCHTKGHSLQKCPIFQEKHPSIRPPRPSSNPSNPPQANVATAFAPTGSTPWLLDSGASHHVAHDLSNLSLHQPYDGTEEVVIGDGTGLPITHTGSTLITTLLRSLRLSNVLCVPNMQRNIISIYKLCLDNNISIEFSSDYFFFKDCLTGEILLTGAPKNGVYEWSSSTESIVAFSNKTSAIDWHHRLGHPALAILKSLLSSFNPNVVNDFSFNCNAYNGGEYQALSTYLATVGISHLTTPPHTPEHNGYAERRHRHIVETGLSLLSHSKLPLEFWPLAFTTATYLINRLPTVTLQHKSPYQCLFGSPPNYLKLRSFGCLCYPWLRPYAQHKLDTRSLPCIFVGYSSTQSAYYCLDPTTHKIYVSRHVRFVETSFPYNQLVSNQTPSSYPKPDSWCPISLPILIPSTLDSQVTHDESSVSLQQSPNSSHPITEAVTQTESNPTIDSQSSSQQPPPLPTSSIITRSKNHIYKPNPKYANPTTTQLKPTEPTTVAQALQDPLWRQAMLDEIRALHKLGTWDLVPPESGQNLQEHSHNLRHHRHRHLPLMPLEHSHNLHRHHQHSKAYRFYIIDPNESVSVNTVIELRDAIFDEERFSSIPRPKDLISNGNEGQTSENLEGISDPKPLEVRKSKRGRIAKNFGSDFQLYLVEGSRDEFGIQYSYCYSIEEDPKSFKEAMESRDAAFWKEAIDDEFSSILENNTWVLSDLPPGFKPLGCKWILKKKMKVYGTIDKFKAWLVIQGFRQMPGIDYFDTYAPVAGISTIRLPIALAAIHNLIVHQMDVKTSFLNGDLDEEVYMNQPEGFVMPGNEHKVCKLVKSLYGLKQAPKKWHQKFDEVILSSGFKLNQSDKCVYSRFGSSGSGVIICLYVDDMLIFGIDQLQVDETKSLLSSKFAMKDMGEADVILGIRITRVNKGIALTVKLMPNKGTKVSQLEYSQAIGCLMYAMTSTRLDIAYAVGRLSRYTSNPSTQHWQAIQRVFKYLKGTMDYGLCYFGYPSILEGYSDASWITHVEEDHSSTTGWVFLLGGGGISWVSKKQTCITNSTMESEFVALAAAGKEAEWLKDLIYEIPLWSKPIAPISIHCDSAATLAKAYSNVYNG